MRLYKIGRRFVSAALVALAFLHPLRSADLVAPNWKNVDLRGMGYVTGIIEHPTKGGPLYIRTDVAGVFRWDPNAARWIDLMNFLPDAKSCAGVNNIESLAVDPSNVNRVFAAFGTYVEDGAESDGILRSDDQGETWDLTRFPSSVPMGGNSWWRHAGERLAVDPKNSDVVYFGSRQNGLWVSTNGGMDWSQVNTYIPLGDNGAATRNGKPTSGGILFVVVDPSKTVLVGTQTRSATVYLGIMGAGIYRSIDGGVNFSAMPDQPSSTLNPIQGRLASDGTLYAVFSADSGVKTGGAVWRWRNGAGTIITPPNSGFTYGSRDWCGLAVDPTDSNRIAINSMNASPRDTFISTDAGANWIILTTDAASSFPPNKHRLVNFKTPSWWGSSSFTWAGGLAFSRDKPEQLWVTTGYGVYRYDNVNASPIEANATDFMHGLEELVVTRVMPLPAATGGGVLVGAVDKAGFVIRDPEVMPTNRLGTTGIINGTGLGVSMGSDALVVSLAQNNYDSGEVLHSTDGGRNWKAMTRPVTLYADGKTTQPLGGDIAISATNTSNVVWLPSNASWLAGSIRPPMYSLDSGQTWSLCVGLPQSFEGLSDVYNGSSNVLVADSVKGNVFYAHHQTKSANGDLYRSVDSGATWTLMSSVIGNHWKSSLVARPGVADEIWYSNRTGRLQRSTDGGASFTTCTGWTEICSIGFGAPLPGKNTGTIYAVGVLNEVRSLFYSTDDGASWTDTGLVATIAYSKVLSVSGDLARPGRVYVATDGRGIFYADLVPPPVAVPTGPKLGSITQDIWTGITGTHIVSVPVNKTPSLTGALTSFETPSNWGDNYGQRVRGFLYPTQSGNYTFWISGDDAVALWLSSDSDPFGKALIAQRTSYTLSREWNKSSAQRSKQIALEAGKTYYIEAVMKEATGSDSLAVAWKRDDTTAPVNGSAADIIPGSALSPWVDYVKNPGFENDLSDWQVWGTASSSSAIGANLTKGALVGSATSNVWGAVAQSIGSSLNPLTTYTIKVTGRKTDINNGAAKLILQVHDGVSLSTNSEVNFTSTSFTDQAITFTTPAKIKWAQFYMQHDGGVGGAIFDQVRIIRP